MKTFLITFFLFISTSILFAQDKRFKLIVSAGMNASQVNGDNLSGFNKVGINAGLGVMRQISKKSAFQFEMLYSEKGSKDVSTPSNPALDTILRFNYIDIPIIYTYSFRPKLKFQIGIYNSVRVKATYDDYVNEFDRSDQIRISDHGVTGGVEYFFAEKFSINGRISQSLLDINSTYESGYYNLVSTFSIRYTL